MFKKMHLFPACLAHAKIFIGVDIRLRKTWQEIAHEYAEIFVQ
jgi:hypothetical protein